MHSERYTIARFRKKYADQVLNLIDSGLKDVGAIPRGDELINDEDLLNIQNFYSNGSRFWIALREKAVIGTVAVKDAGNGEAFLKRMFCLPRYHGKGLGQELLNTAISFARMRCYTRMLLTTHKSMERARRFYEKNGFEQTGFRKDLFYYELTDL